MLTIVSFISYIHRDTLSHTFVATLSYLLCYTSPPGSRIVRRPPPPPRPPAFPLPSGGDGDGGILHLHRAIIRLKVSVRTEVPRS